MLTLIDLTLNSAYGQKVDRGFIMMPLTLHRQQFRLIDSRHRTLTLILLLISLPSSL